MKNQIVSTKIKINQTTTYNHHNAATSSPGPSLFFSRWRPIRRSDAILKKREKALGTRLHNAVTRYSTLWSSWNIGIHSGLSTREKFWSEVILATVEWPVELLPCRKKVKCFTPRIKPWVNKYGCTFWVCGWNPSVWPFKWKLLSSTFKWYCLFLTFLKNEIQDFLITFLTFFFCSKIKISSPYWLPYKP